MKTSLTLLVITLLLTACSKPQNTITKESTPSHPLVAATVRAETTLDDDDDEEEDYEYVITDDRVLDAGDDSQPDGGEDQSTPLQEEDVSEPINDPVLESPQDEEFADND